MKIKIVMPTKETPGFLRRARQSAEFASRLKNKEATPELYDAMVDFILPFIEEPKDREVARNALLDASQTQFEEILQEFSGGGKDTAVPPESNPTS